MSLKLRKAIHYLTHWECWHWFAKYILIAPAWLWFCLRARSLWFFTSSNPNIIFGGYAGELKMDVYKSLPPHLIPVSIAIDPMMSLTEVVRLMDTSGLQYPVAVKPAAGLMGFMFRKIHSLQQLKQYHNAMRFPYILQEYIDLPVEVSVFYYRMPGKSKGTITGFICKECLQVKGDGQSTLLKLINAHPRAWLKMEELKSKHASRLHEIIPAGGTFMLSYAFNLSRGGKLVNIEDQKDDQLLQVFDAMSHDAGFYFGRYDIKCHQPDDLKTGKGFYILELNGCGGEPHHVYGNHNTLWKACSILIQHWHQLFLISSYNNRNGTPFWPHKKAWPYMINVLRYFIELKKLDHAFDLHEEKTETSSGRLSPTSSSLAAIES